MGNNETLTMPQPSVDVIDMQVSAAPTPEEAAAIYTYQRQDGTVERARSAQDAIDRCPVLGKLAIEDPEQANVLLELAADGEDSTLAAASSQQKPEEQKLDETVKADNKTEPKIERLATTSSDVPVISESAIIAAAPMHRLDKIQPVDQTTSEEAWHVTEIHRLIGDQIDKLQQPAETGGKAAAQRQEPALVTREKVIPRIETADAADRMHIVEYRDNQSVVAEEQNTANKPVAAHDHADPEEPIKFKAAPGDTAWPTLAEDIRPVTVEISSVFDDPTPVFTLQPDAPAPAQMLEAIVLDQPEADRLSDFQELESSIDEVEPYTDIPGLVEARGLPQHEAIFDDEVMDTFEQLIELVYVEVATIPSSGIEQPLKLLEGQAILTRPEVPEPIEPNIFEEFVASITKPKDIPDLDTIMTSANEQTLEETLVQLSLYLTETGQDSESPPVIQKTLRNLAELLSGDGSDDTVEKDKLSITPELTQQLLTLLRAVGYDSPQEVILAFVKEHNFEFLVAAIRHLSQLCDNDRHELLHIQSALLLLSLTSP